MAGTYDRASPFTNDKGNRVYSVTLGAATLTAGMVIGGNGAANYGLLQGVVFNVTAPSKTFLGAEVNIWGTAGIGAQVYDTTLHGNGVIGSGVFARQIEAVRVERVVLDFFNDYGVLIDNNIQGSHPNVWPELHDVNAQHIKLFSNPGGSHGRAEACVWLGNSTMASRLLLTDCSWSGIWTGTANWYSDITDFKIVDSGWASDSDGHGAALYVEHFTTGTTFSNFAISGSTKASVICEWDDPAPPPPWGGVAACDWVVFQDGTITGGVAGVYLDRHTPNTTVQRIKYINQSWAGTGENQGINNTIVDNDCSQIAPELCYVSGEMP